MTQAQLDTIVTILDDRVNAGTSGATVDSQGKNQISVSIPGEKNTQQILATLGNTAQLFFRPALCYAPAFTVAKGQTPSTGPLPTCAAVDPADRRPTCRCTPEFEQRQRLHQQHQHPGRPPVRHLPVDLAAQRQQERHRAPARHRGRRAAAATCSGPAG